MQTPLLQLLMSTAEIQASHPLSWVDEMTQARNSMHERGYKLFSVIPQKTPCCPV